MTVENSNGDQPSELDAKIIRQMEYYFGNINLGRDKFMQIEVAKNEGWLSKETMLNFKRLTSFSNDWNVITAAIRKSNSDLIEISEDGDKVRRNPSKPLPNNSKEFHVNLKQRTVYVKGFPVNMEMQPILDFFLQFGETENVFMRRNLSTKEFKGSVWVTFCKLEDAKKFVELPVVRYEGASGRDLNATNAKKEEEKETKGDNEEVSKDSDEVGKMDSEQGVKDSDIVECDKDDKEEDDEKSVACDGLIRMFKEDYFQTKNNKKKAVITEAETVAKKEEEKMLVMERLTPGALLKVSGLASDLLRDDLKTEMNNYGVEVAWADFETGDTEATIRFNQRNGAIDVMEKVKAGPGKVKIKDTEVEAHVLEGEEEFKHWENMFAAIDQRRRESRMRKRDMSNRGYGRGAKRRRN